MKQEKPNYGHVAWKYFAYMGFIGSIGIILWLIGPILFPMVAQVLLVMGLTIAVIGFWIACSYLILYPGLLRAQPDRDFLSKTLSDSLTGNEHVLDVGCGTGRVAIQFAKRLPEGKVTGIDIYKGVSGNTPKQAIDNARLEGVGDRVTFQHGNVLDLHFPDASFDVVSMGSVLHELHNEEDKLHALKEAMRVIKPGGNLVIFELLRSPRMLAIMLFFGFVWKTKDYWIRLFSIAGLGSPSVIEKTMIIKIATFIISKS